jgi:acyl carrier protein
VDKQGIFTEIVDLLRAMDGNVNHRVIRFDDTPFKEYGIDSLTQIRLAAEVEERFDVVINDSDAFIATSFVRLVDLIEGKLNPAAGGRS